MPGSGASSILIWEMVSWSDLVLPWGDSRREGWPRAWSELVNFSVLSLSLCLLLTWPLRNLSSLHKLFSSVWCRLQSRESCPTSSTPLPLAYHPSRTLHRPLSLPGTHTLALLCLANLTASSKIPQVSSPPESLTGQSAPHGAHRSWEAPL